MRQLPGTVIETTDNNCRQIIDSLFAGGGIVLSQVCTITGLETHMVQNWVKRKFVSSPIDKKYSKRQFCRIILINALKDTLPLNAVADLISYINGKLDLESDDSIDDSELYFYFTDLAFSAHENLSETAEAVKKITDNYKEPVPGASKKIEQVLFVMLGAYLSAEYRKKSLIVMESILNYKI